MADQAVSVFKRELAQAMANELTMLRADRDQWEIAALGIMVRMGLKNFSIANNVVQFDVHGPLDIPPIVQPMTNEDAVGAGEDEIIGEVVEDGESTTGD